MRKLILGLTLLFNVCSAQTTSILWLGNSYTAFNNLPDLVYQLALSGGDTVTFDSYTPGGYTLDDHWNSLTSQLKINQQPWDYVVLQAQSQEPALDSAFVTNWVLPYAEGLDSLVHLNDSCTQTVFYMTWGRKNGDAQNCTAYPPVCTYQGMQDQLRNRYLQMGHDNDAIVAPCGEAWRDVIATTPAFDLYIADESHPSLHGSYLNACVFYATIYRRSPVGLSYTGGLSSADALFLQQYAAATVLDSMSVWNTEIYYDDPSFTATLTSGTTYSFTANTAATDHEWNFGQGFATGTANETYTFPSNGWYVVTHVTWNGCHSDTSTQTVIVGPQSIPEIPGNNLNVYPSPADDVLSVTNPFDVNEQSLLEVFDVSGRIVFTSCFLGNTAVISVSFLPEGVYTVRVTQQQQTTLQTVSILHR
ncbi:MAG TPA: T9SS type A sorting domain-containing protein [Bacteroidia bacterium]|nr:T9SS type A sorting domain-containing protein [Bacteroidia bacterium]